ncbi:MAG TPA: phospholipid carrier-dependent glycosyltransferase [Actinomycetota bacterium]|nr:phospholipid carrier-dependent glycosyltransferase [Actinomycetota bacterium]
MTEPAPRGRRAWTRVDTIAVAAVTLAAGVLRFARLGDPRSIMFDETYYARDACWYALASESTCGIAGEENYVHPPLGKWLIGAGIDLFGYDAFGWRVAAALAGTVTVALLYVLARRVLGSTVGAAFASGLLAIDLLHFVQSRIAMLDVFVAAFGVAAFSCAVLDRDRDGGRRRWARPWAGAAGACAGAAFASKWSGALVLAGVVLLVVAWEVSARRDDGGGAPLRRTLTEAGPWLALWLVAVPLAVYVASYAARLDGAVWALPWSDDSWWRALWDRQVEMYSSHRGLSSASHRYQSPPWSWPLLRRPVSYFFETAPNGDYLEVLATGSPFVWWSSLLALAYAAWRWTRVRTWRSAEAVVVAGFAVSYAPWLVLAAGRGAVFIFYLLPAVPFMCLALGYVAARIGSSWEARAAQVVFAAAAVGMFGFYYPLVAKEPLPRAAWEARIWIFDDCDPVARERQTTVETSDGATVTRTEDDAADRPTDGWCWI